MTFDEINVLGNLLNTTFGRSSTQKAPTHSVTGSVQGNMLILKLVTVIMLSEPETHRERINDYRVQSKKALNKHLEDIKAAFNKQCKTKYKFKEVECSDFVDPVSFRPTGLPSSTVFRMTMICEIE